MSRLSAWLSRRVSTCPCGRLHEVPGPEAFVGADAPLALGEFLARPAFRPLLLLADRNTLEAGRAARAAVRAETEVVLEAGVESDVSNALAVARRAEEARSACILTVGSGTVTDLGKHAAYTLGIPLVAFPTAASVNGYLSPIAALKVGGLKSTLPSAPPVAVFASPVVLSSAPRPMAAAGLADLASKPCSDSDWYLAHRLRGEPYCPLPGAMVGEAFLSALSSAQALGEGDPEALGLLFEALLLSGLSMAVAGSSAPASGGEHLVSHYIDMRAALEGFSPALHGAQVGLGILHSLTLYGRLLARLGEDFDPKSLAARAPGFRAVEILVRRRFPEPLSSEILVQARSKHREGHGLECDLRKLHADRTMIRQALETNIIEAGRMEAAIRLAGGPTTPEEAGLPGAVYQDALAEAFAIRGRYTILDLARALSL